MPSPAVPHRFDVVALATSAGGLDALSTVLGALPANLPAAVLVMQHLGRYGSALVGILEGRTALPVAWVEDGERLTPGRVLVCPPQRMVEIQPDGACRVLPGVRRAPDLPIDALFRTLADSVGPRAIGVVLTGLGSDGAEGVRALDRAGAIVLAQSEHSAEHRGMPRAAAETGAVDLVLPLDEIGPTLVGVLAGGVLPQSRAEVAARAALFTGRGAAQVGPLLADTDWTATTLGPVTHWPEPLCTAVRLALTSHVPMTVYWGPEFVQLDNDAALAVRGRAPEAAGIGRPVGESAIALPTPAMLERVMRTGDAIFAEDQEVARDRGGVAEEAYVTFSCTPILDAAAPQGVGGVLAVATETTARVLGARRARTLRALVAARTEGGRTLRAAVARAAELLGENPHDIPFALLYLVGESRRCAQLAAAVGFAAGDAATPAVIDLENVRAAWPRDASPPVLLPLRAGPDDGANGVLVLGVSPRLPLDTSYHDFFDLAATLVDVLVADARALERREHP